MSLPVRSGTASAGSSASPARGSVNDRRGTSRPRRARSRRRSSRPCFRRSVSKWSRPRPVPPNFRVELPSACSNSRKIRAWSSGEMPMPVSRTEMRDRVGLLARLDDDRDAAALGELDRVAGEVEQHLAQSRRVADDARRQALVDIAADFEPLGLGARAEQLDRLLDEGRERERPRRQIEPAGLDLGEIENLLDQRQQRLARGLHRLQVSRLLLGQPACRRAGRPCRECR